MDWFVCISKCGHRNIYSLRLSSFAFTFSSVGFHKNGSVWIKKSEFWVSDIVYVQAHILDVDDA